MKHVIYWKVKPLHIIKYYLEYHVSYSFSQFPTFYTISPPPKKTKTQYNGLNLKLSVQNYRTENCNHARFNSSILFRKIFSSRVLTLTLTDEQNGPELINMTWFKCRYILIRKFFLFQNKTKQSDTVD